jgi:hypothetical protein
VTWFQLVTLPVTAILLLRSLLHLIRGRRLSGPSLLGPLIWLLAGVAILNPDLTTRIAKLLGIGRGADLLIYLLALAFLFLVFYLYQRFQRIESALTELARHIAIQEAKATASNASSAAPVSAADARDVAS